MPGLRTRFLGLELPATTPLDYPDDTMSATTRALLDFVSGTGRPQSLPAGSGVVAVAAALPLRNYADPAAPGLTRGPLGYQNGLVLTGNQPSAYVELPRSFFPAGLTNFAIGLWLNGTALGVNGSANRLVSVVAQGNAQFAIDISAGSDLAPTGITLSWPGFGDTLTFTGLHRILFDQAVHQLWCEFCRHPTNSALAKTRVYLDGSLFYEGVYSTFSGFAAPGSGDIAAIGGPGSPGTASAKVYRTRFEDLSATGDPAASILATVQADYAAHAARFA